MKRYKDKNTNKSKKKYGDKTKTVLELLMDSTFSTIDLFGEAFGSPQNFYKTMYRVRYGGPIFKQNQRKNYNDAELQNFYTLLNRLKNQGFIVKKQSQHGSIWNITKRGLEKLGLINKKKKTNYDLKKDNKVKIIVFDVPECDRKKRAWLREALVALEFSILQKSVWVGKNKIPEQFLIDLHDMHLINYIHILKVGASGTVKELT